MSSKKSRPNVSLTVGKKVSIETSYVPAIVLSILCILAIGFLFQVPFPFWSNPRMLRFAFPVGLVWDGLVNLTRFKGGYFRFLLGIVVFLGMSGSFLLTGNVVLKKIFPWIDRGNSEDCGPPEISGLEILAASWAVGSLLFSLFGLILGSFGLLNPVLMVFVIVVGLIYVLKQVKSSQVKYSP